VLELSSKYQPYFGPLRYAVAGVTRFVSLPSFESDIDFLPCAHFYSPPPPGPLLPPLLRLGAPWLWARELEVGQGLG